MPGTDAEAAPPGGLGDANAPRVLVVPEPELFLAPAACACCLGVGAQSLKLTSSSGATVSLNYCESCLRHASAARTRILATCLASFVLGLTAAAALPVVFLGIGVDWVVLVALLLALAPVAVALGWPRPPEAGHASSGDAVWWRGKQQLYCDNPRFARMAARANGLECVSASRAKLRWSSWYWLGPVATLVALPASLYFNTATLRVLNLTPSTYSLVVDGRVLGDVDSTSSESPSAGREFRIGAGPRRLTAISAEGEVLWDRRVVLRGGAPHLFAPGNDKVCFWLEFTSYGRQKAKGPARRELSPGAGFWPIPAPVDSWFAPSPLPAADDDRSSGGRLTAVRQGSCRSGPT